MIISRNIMEKRVSHSALSGEKNSSAAVIQKIQKIFREINSLQRYLNIKNIDFTQFLSKNTVRQSCVHTVV